MRGRLLALAVGTVLLTAALLGGAQAGPGKKGHACPMGGGKMSCPMMVEGAEATVANIANGVTITVTAKDPEAVKKIQEAAASHVKDGKFACGCPCCQGKGHKCAECDKHKAEKKDEKKAEEKKPEGQK